MYLNLKYQFDHTYLPSYLSPIYNKPTDFDSELQLFTKAVSSFALYIYYFFSSRFQILSTAILMH